MKSPAVGLAVSELTVREPYFVDDAPASAFLVPVPCHTQPNPAHGKQDLGISLISCPLPPRQRSLQSFLPQCSLYYFY